MLPAQGASENEGGLHIMLSVLGFGGRGADAGDVAASKGFL